MNQNALRVGLFAVRDKEYFQETVGKIVKTREWVKEELAGLGFESTDSKTNFLFTTHKSKGAKEIFEALKERDIFVRYFNAPRIDNYLRITIGTDEEMRSLIQALKDIIH